MSISSFVDQTSFNVKNAMASQALSDLMKVRKSTIRDCLSSFEQEGHRMEEVLSIGGVQYINDAKANNVNATYYALENMDKHTIWIVNGEDDKSNYEVLLPLVNEKVRAIICVGHDNGNLIQTFANVADFLIESDSIEEAVKIAYHLSEPQEVVLFSPAGSQNGPNSSFDQIGSRFKEAVRNL